MFQNKTDSRKSNFIFGQRKIRKENLDKIHKMSYFKYDWDGQCGQPFSKKEIALFRGVIQKLTKQPEIAPTGRNSLYLQYKGNDDSTLGFEVALHGTTEVYIPFGEQLKTVVKIIAGDIAEEMNEDIENFYKKHS